MNRYFFLISLLFCFLGQAQSYKGSIEKNKKEGLYKILIPSEVRSAIQDNLNHFRILDENKKEVPFVIFENTQQYLQRYNKLKVLRKTIIKDSITSIEIPFNYPSQKYSTELALQIINTTIDKKYSISGSNDQKEWFGLVSNQKLTGLNNVNDNSIKKIISFPSNNYSFLKVEFNDKESLPINVIEVGYFRGEQNVIETAFINNFKFKIIEDSKSKLSIIKFSADDFHSISGISFNIKNSRFFRTASVFINGTKKSRKNDESQKKLVANFNLNSNTNNNFKWDSFQAKEFEIQIENLDNQPLDIKEIKLFQNPLYVITDLKANAKYEVIVDETLLKPQYDLENFIPENTKDLKILKILDFKKEGNNSIESSQKFWQTKWFLWICLVFGGLLVGYFAFSLLNDIKSKD